MSSALHSILSIAGSDPTGGAGIQADIRCGQSLGVHVMTAITAVTVQNSSGLKEIGAVSSALLKAQLDAIMSDVLPDAIKIGVIGSVENLYVIYDFLNSIPSNIKIVIDPVLKVSADNSSTACSCTIEEFASLYIRYLFPLATVITPNIPELNIFVKNLDSFDTKILTNLNAEAVIIKGGHSSHNLLDDTLITANGLIKKSHSRYECINLHGTGCVFSSLLASYLALGKSLTQAFNLSVAKINRIISKSCDYSFGFSNYGPLNINNYKL